MARGGGLTMLAGTQFPVAVQPPVREFVKVGASWPRLVYSREELGDILPGTDRLTAFRRAEAAQGR